MMKLIRIPKPHVIEHHTIATPHVSPGHVLVKVRAVGVCMSDLEIYEGTRPLAYVKYPITPGHEWCGDVVALGAEVTGLNIGDRVAVEGHNFCGSCFFCKHGQTNLCQTYSEFGFTLDGAYCEHVNVRHDLAHPFSPSLPYEQAALTEPAACAGHGMMRAQVQAGETVCVIGPGTIGLLGVAWARRFGAAKIVVFGIDHANEALARAVGATHYFTPADGQLAGLHVLTDGRGADVVFEAAGAPTAIPLAFDAARRGGRVVLMGIVGGGRKLDAESDAFVLKELHVDGIFAYTSAAFVQTLRQIESGGLDVRPLITHRMSMKNALDALMLMKSKREPVAKIVLTP